MRSEYGPTKSNQTTTAMSSVLNICEAKAKLSEVVERVSRGEEVIITRIGHPVARVTP